MRNGSQSSSCTLGKEKFKEQNVKLWSPSEEQWYIHQRKQRLSELAVEREGDGVQDYEVLSCMAPEVIWEGRLSEVS